MRVTSQDKKCCIWWLLNIHIHLLNNTILLLVLLFLKIKYGDTATSEGVLFATYSALIGESQAGGQHRTRIKQILDWCKPDFDGVVSFYLWPQMLRFSENKVVALHVCRIFALDFFPQQIIFDECHKAKNATSTKMGKAVLDLQNKLPRARVVYASATGRLMRKTLRLSYL